MSKRRRTAKEMKPLWIAGFPMTSLDCEALRKLTLWHRACCASQDGLYRPTLNRTMIEEMMRSIYAEVGKAMRDPAPKDIE